MKVEKRNWIGENKERSGENILFIEGERMKKEEEEEEEARR